MDARVELKLVTNKALAFPTATEETGPSLASAKKAVPLLWLSLFNYEETSVRQEGPLEIFAATTSVKSGVARAQAMAKVLPQQHPLLLRTANTLAKELKKVPAKLFLTLFPVEVFAGLRTDASRMYIEQLVGLCDLWEKLRQGTSWDELQKPLQQICPDFSAIVQHQDPRVTAYFLIGSLADKQDQMSELIIHEGQSKDDQKPEALAVGESGLLLGRFQKKWKLMSSGCYRDLLAVWSDGETAYLAGRAGSVIQLKDGCCTPMEVPATRDLLGIWGMNDTFVCIVGDEGTLLFFNGKAWQPWPVPTRASLHCISGSGPDNIFLGSEDLSLLRFDGYSWSRFPLPDDRTIGQLQVEKNMVFAVGGSSRGGELFRLERGGWNREKGLPLLDWLTGIWKGWGTEIGVISSRGPALVRKGDNWFPETLPVERVVAVAAGSIPMVLGTSGKYNLILSRSDQVGWQIEAAVPDLTLNALWVAGKPKPPRISIDGEPNA